MSGCNHTTLFSEICSFCCRQLQQKTVIDHHQESWKVKTFTTIPWKTKNTEPGLAGTDAVKIFRDFEALSIHRCNFRACIVRTAPSRDCTYTIQNTLIQGFSKRFRRTFQQGTNCHLRSVAQSVYLFRIFTFALLFFCTIVPLHLTRALSFSTKVATSLPDITCQTQTQSL